MQLDNIIGKTYLESLTMQYYLGLDVGSYSVKSIVLRLDGEQYQITEAFEQVIEYNSKEDAKLSVTLALRTVLQTLDKKKFDSIFTSIGCQNTVIKKFELNNVNRSDREKVIENEFDLMGIFDLTQYIIEYHTIEYRPKYAKLMGILINKNNSRELIDIVTHCGLNVRVIDIDNTVLLNANRFIPLAQNGVHNEPVLFLDLGHTKSSMTVICKNKVIFSRYINIAGLHLTQMIQERAKVSFDKAQYIKHNIESERGNLYYNDVEKIIENFFNNLFKEINLTLKVIRSNEFIEVKKIYVLGGAARLNNFNELAQRHFSTPFEVLNNLSSDIDRSCIRNDILPSYIQSISSAIRGDFNELNSKINIRHGELALISNYEKIVSETLGYFKVVFVFFIILLSVYLLRYFLFESKINNIKNIFKKDVIEVYSYEPRELRMLSSKPDFDFKIYSNKSIELVSQAIKSRKYILQETSVLTIPFPIKVLNDISIAVPQGTYFEVVDFKVNDKVLNITADTNNIDNVSKIISAIKNIPYLLQVEKNSQSKKPGTENQIIRFSLSASVNNKE